MSPGMYWGKHNRGYEVSLLYFQNDFGAFSGAGLVYGFDRDNPARQYLEFEVGGSGWLLAGFTLSAGAVQTEADKYLPQATAAFQLLPCYFFVRWQKDEEPPDFGIMIKIPLPASRRYEDNGQGEGVWHLGFS